MKSLNNWQKTIIILAILLPVLTLTVMYYPSNEAIVEVEDEIVEENLTVWQEGAIEDAEGWLDGTGISRESLITQLQFQGHEKSDAEFAADYLVDDWQQQAMLAVEYHFPDTTSSRDEFIFQLEFEGYSNEHATYAVDNSNIDWNDQALKAAQNFIYRQDAPEQDRYDYLIDCSFTEEQAKYGAENSTYIENF